MRRTAPGSTTLFVYDEAGQLLGQYDGAGNPLQQYIWLDTLPVGVIAGGTVYHVQPDHLGTARRWSVHSQELLCLPLDAARRAGATQTP